MVEKVFDSDANFLLVRVTDADAVYAYLRDNGIVARNRNRVALCRNACGSLSEPRMRTIV